MMKDSTHIRRFNESEENSVISYSEEEVLKLLEEYEYDLTLADNLFEGTPKQWFEQYAGIYLKELSKGTSSSISSDSDDIKQMSLEEKLLRMKLKMNDETLTLSQMECVIDAMKEVSLQRKLGNWTDKLK